MSGQTDGIWIIDAEARTIFANERMAEILGSSTSLKMGESSFEYIFPQDLPNARLLFDSKKQGDPSPFRFTLRRKDGCPVSVIVQGTPMHNPAGEFIGIVGTFSVAK